MKPFLRWTAVLLVSLLLSFTGNSQEIIYNNEPVLEFSQDDFGDRFCVMAQGDSDASYYVIDQTKLPGEFGRIYFLNLIYQDNKVVNIDPDIHDDQMWYKASSSYTDEEIVCLMDELREKTIQKESSLNQDEKASWLKKNSKFNIK